MQRRRRGQQPPKGPKKNQDTGAAQQATQNLSKGKEIFQFQPGSTSTNTTPGMLGRPPGRSSYRPKRRRNEGVVFDSGGASSKDPLDKSMQLISTETTIAHGLKNNSPTIGSIPIGKDPSSDMAIDQGPLIATNVGMSLITPRVSPSASVVRIPDADSLKESGK